MGGTGQLLTSRWPGSARRPTARSQAELDYFAVRLSSVVKWVTITPDRAAFPSLGRSARRPLNRTVTSKSSEADMRQTTISGHHDAGYHAKTMIRSSLLAAASSLAAAVTFAAPVQATSIDTRFDICSALRNGTSLATIEASLEARGYSAYNAGALTGITIRQQCPDQAANATAQVQRAGA
jgi:hypothetical protein